MKIINAIKKLEKAGFELEDLGNRVRAVSGRHVITFCKSGEDACAFGSTTTDASEYNTPLFGWPSLTALIKCTVADVVRDQERKAS